LSVAPPPIYLHFLDRELGDAFEFTLDFPTAQRVLAILTLGTASLLSCSLSALLENPALTGDVGMVTDLVREKVLVPRSTHATMSEFLESRRTMYEHDQDRYPLYFGGTPLGELDQLQPRLDTGSTTRRLHDKLLVWSDGQATLHLARDPLPPEPRARMLTVVAGELAHRDERAVTYAMFNAVLAGDPSGAVVEREVRQRISLEYSAIQRGEQSRLASGLAFPLDLVEQALGHKAPFELNLEVLRALLEVAGLGVFLSGWPRSLWQSMLPLRGTREHRRMVSYIQWIATALDGYVSPTGGRALRRSQATAILKPHIGTIPGPAPTDADDALIAAQLKLAGLAERLEQDDAAMKIQLDAARNLLEPLEADVLLIVATPTELNETFAEFGFGPGKMPRPHPKGMQIYWELGDQAGRRVFLVRSNMGAGGAGGSLVTAEDAIEDLSPDWVVMVGIAYGADSTTQNIGDILVPTKEIPVDHQKVSSENGKPKTEFRDDPIPADETLLKRMREGIPGFTGAVVTLGPVLSGSTLIDNEDYRDALIAQASRGRAIGGEMELHGVASAANGLKARWGAAKAICDFADGDKAKDKPARQKLAARNAARFVGHLLDVGLLAPPGD
jgi:nucleoside phosphorylase